MAEILEIRLRQNGPVFSQLPLAEAVEYLQRRKKENPQLTGEYQSILSRIKHLETQFAEVIRFQASEADRIENFHLKHLTSDLVSRKIGEMYCMQCNKSIEAPQIIYETYTRESTSGKRFYCRGNNHLILDLVDLKRIN